MAAFIKKPEHFIRVVRAIETKRSKFGGMSVPKAKQLIDRSIECSSISQMEQ